MLEDMNEATEFQHVPDISTRSSGLWWVRFEVKNGSELFFEDRLAVKPMDCKSLAFPVIDAAKENHLRL